MYLITESKTHSPVPRKTHLLFSDPDTGLLSDTMTFVYSLLHQDPFSPGPVSVGGNFTVFTEKNRTGYQGTQYPMWMTTVGRDRPGSNYWSWGDPTILIGDLSFVDPRSIIPDGVYMFTVPFPTHRTVRNGLRYLFRVSFLIQSSVKEKVGAVAFTYVSRLIDLTQTT